MAELSEAVCILIRRFPLQPNIGRLKERLKKITPRLETVAYLQEAEPVAASSGSSASATEAGSRSESGSEVVDDTEGSCSAATRSEQLLTSLDVKDVLLDLLSCFLSHRIAKQLRAVGSSSVAGACYSLQPSGL